MPRTGGDHNFVVQSKSLMGILDQNKSALLAMSITGRLPVPIPDGCNKRVNVNPLYAAFPLQGNTALGTPALVDSNGNFSLSIKASLKGTITTQNQAANGVVTTYMQSYGPSRTKTQNNAELYSYTIGGNTYSHFEAADDDRMVGVWNGNAKVAFPFPLPNAASNPSKYYPVSVKPTSNLALSSPYGYLMQAGQTYTAFTEYNSTLGSLNLAWYNATTGAQIGSAVTLSSTVLQCQITVGTSSNATAGQYCFPVFLNSSTPFNITQYGVSLTTTDTTNTAPFVIDMPQSNDSLCINTYKKSRITGFAVWFQNTSNITKVGGDCGAFWLNPDQAASYSLPDASGVIAAASTRTRDRYVGPFVNGIYTFERIHRENLVFQPTLEIDDGYRLIIAGSPGAASAAEVQGYLHIWMILESEVESSILAGSIAPHMVNVMAEFETAVSRIPNNVMENSAHAQILSAIMKAGSKVGGAIRNVVSLPWVKNAAGAGASAVLHNLANSASPGYNYGPAMTPYQSSQRRQRRPVRRR